MSSIETVIVNKLILEHHRTISKLLCTHQDDAMGCSDHIIHNHTILNSCKYGISNNACKVHAKVYDQMTFKNRVGNQVSNTIYKNTTELELHGVDQATGNGGIHWTFISVPMMEILEQVTPGCIIKLPSDHQKWKVKMIGFVDD